MASAGFVEQLYSKFLGRSADLAGKAYWTGLLDGGGMSAAQATSHFINNPEFAATVRPVAMLYYTAFGRIPDAAGLSYWVAQHRAGSSIGQIAASFAASSEFLGGMAGATGDSAFLDRMYLNVFGRTADAAGKAYWLDLLQAGRLARGDVLAGFAGSTEYVAAKGAEVGLIVQYHAILGVAPTRADIDAGLAAQNALSFIDSLYASSAYRGVSVPGVPDSTAPVLSGASYAGRTIVLQYNERGSLDDVNVPAPGAFAVVANGALNLVTAVQVNALERSVTLTLATPLARGSAVTLSYTDRSGGNDAAVLQDAAGNDAASLFKVAVADATPGDGDLAAPELTAVSVSGAAVLLQYADSSPLDSTHLAPAAAFAVKVNGATVPVLAVTVDAAARTVHLALPGQVDSSAVVSVSYTDPSAANDSAALQDSAGNDAASFVNRIAVNGNPEALAPVIGLARIDGNVLVVNYSDEHGLDGAHGPLPASYAVLADKQAYAVLTAVVNVEQKTVTLTLAAPVPSGAVVTLSYTDPSTANDAQAVQDPLGNDAVSVKAHPVTNVTIDTIAPVLLSAAVNGATVTLRYTEGGALDAVNKAAPGAFTIMAGGVAVAVLAVQVDALEDTVTLTLASLVAVGAVVTLAYADPTSGNDNAAVQDGAGNDALSVAARTVTNNTADTTAPVLLSASVNASTLVLTYTESSALDALHKPAPSAFSVLEGGRASVVSAVAVDANAKTVTLTLAAPVAVGAEVSLNYTVFGTNATNAIQDTAGNDAASLVAQPVTNNTLDTIAPVFKSATVDGNTLVLSYTEANSLDAVHLPESKLFAVLAAGLAVTVDSVAVDASAKTVTLKLAAPVAVGAVVTVAYTDPSAANDANTVQDGAGNDAASMPARSVNNGTVDKTGPLIVSAAVSGNTLTLTYSEALDASKKPAASSFAVLTGGAANAVTAVVIDSAAKTVALTLTTAAAIGATVLVSYADLTSGNDTDALQDVTGNDAESLIAYPVVNNSTDVTPPVLLSASVLNNVMLLTYTETSTLDGAHPPPANLFAVLADGLANAVTGVAVDAVLKTVSLTLANPVAVGVPVTLAYTDPTSANDVNAVQDAAGNDAASFVARPVTNNSSDTVAPVLASASVNGNQLTLTYTDGALLDALRKPAAAQFAVLAGGAANTVSSVVVNAANKTVTLTLATPVPVGAVVTVSYIDPSSANDLDAIQDAHGNDAVSLISAPVTNVTLDTAGPAFASASVNEQTLTITFTDANPLDAANVPGPEVFAVLAGGVAIAVSAVSVNSAAKTATLTLATPVAIGAAVSVRYTDVSSANDVAVLQDALGNDAPSFLPQTVTNLTADLIAPTFVSAEVNASLLTLSYADANGLDPVRPPSANMFTVLANGANVVVSNALVTGPAAKVTLVLANTVPSGAVVTVSYTNSPANDLNAIQDPSGNDSASLVSQSVLNSTPDSVAPVFSSATVSAASLVMQYADSGPLDPVNLPMAADFAVAVDGAGNLVQSVVVDGAAKTVTLALSTPVASGSTVLLSYFAPAGGNGVNAIQDSFGNDALTLTNAAVTNATMGGMFSPNLHLGEVISIELVGGWTGAGGLIW